MRRRSPRTTITSAARAAIACSTSPGAPATCGGSRRAASPLSATISRSTVAVRHAARRDRDRVDRLGAPLRREGAQWWHEGLATEACMPSTGTDNPILSHIQELVAEEHALFDQGGLDESQTRRLHSIQVELDQCWDLLRQRRAARETGH